MKNLLLASAILFLGTQTSYGQIDKTDDVKKSLETSNKDTIAWVYGGFVNVGMNEGFLHNWAAGGELVSMAINGIFSGHLDKLHHRNVWSNNLDVTYGVNYTYSTGFLPKKTDDRIDFTSKYGMKLDTGKNFYLTGLFNFKSQFTKGYDYTIEGWDTTASANTSTRMSPAYFTTAIGLEYRRGSDVSIFFSPLAGRLTMADRRYTQGPQGAFGIPHNETSFLQLGAYFSGRYMISINKKAIFKTRLDLYSNYLAKDTRDSSGIVIKKDNPGNINVLFDNLFSWKVSKFFNVTLGATFMYDNNIPYSKTYVDNTGATVTKDDPGKNLGWLQIKQVFSLGLEYKF